MISFKERGRSLFTLKVYFEPHSSSFTLCYDGINKHFYGTKEEFKLFLQRMNVSDSKTLPKSKRQITYKQIVDDIIENRDLTICMWSNVFNKLPNRMKIKGEI